MASEKIKPDQLGTAINKTLETFAEATGDALAAAVKDTAREGARIVRQGAAQFGDRYAGDIKPRNYRDTLKKGGRTVSMYITAGPHYRVAHLLEHGHAIVSGGRVRGFVKGRAHWEQGQSYIDRNFVKNLEKKIEEERT